VSAAGAVAVVLAVSVVVLAVSVALPVPAAGAAAVLVASVTGVVDVSVAGALAVLVASATGAAPELVVSVGAGVGELVLVTASVAPLAVAVAESTVAVTPGNDPSAHDTAGVATTRRSATSAATRPRRGRSRGGPAARAGRTPSAS
jgi:hypothetical protein